MTSPESPLDDTAWHRLHAEACEPYRAVSRWSWHWARGKLGRDPVFRGLLERGDLPARARVVDIGCGQGLIASLLMTTAEAAAAGRWPSAWPPAPSATAYTGIELMPRDTARAVAALGARHLLAREAGAETRSPRFVTADMRQAPLPPCDVVVILDVLHYVDHAAQDALLQRAAQALAPRGRLLLRVGDRARGTGYRASRWVDLVVTRVRGHRAAPTWARPLDEWQSLLQRLGFAVEAVPMSRGTPFANVLLVADLRPVPS